jgi:hypothetical protein
VISGAGESPGPAWLWRRPIAWIVLGALMALSATLIWAWSAQQTLLSDVWGYAVRTATQPAGEYLFNPPPGKHLIAVPLLLYKAAFDGFGIGSYAPYRAAHIVLLLLCAALFYALVRRRVGDSLAVLPTAILLFLGTSWEVVAAPFRMPSLVAIAAGLGMLLAFERRDLKGDVAACLLLLLSLASHSTSFAFAAAAVVLVLSRPGPERWRRCWVFALPIAAYAIWWLFEFDSVRSGSAISIIADLPVFLGKSLGATLLATAGLMTHEQYGGIDIPRVVEGVLGAILIALLAALVVVRLRRPRPISAFTLAMVAALLTFWLATGLAPGPERIANSARYFYPDALLFLLLLCELGRDFDLPRRLTPRVSGAILALFAVSIAGNLYELRVQERALNTASDHERAGLTAIALVGPAVPPTLSLKSTLAGRFPASDTIVEDAAGMLKQVFARYGSPAYSPSELESRPQAVRVTADFVAVQAAGGALRPAAVLPQPRNPPPRGLLAFGGKWAPASRGCIALQPSGDSAAGVISTPTGRLALAAKAGPPVVVRVGRFADGTAVPLGTVPGGAAAELDLPAESGAPGDWRVGVLAHQRVLVCTTT